MAYTNLQHTAPLWNIMLHCVNTLNRCFILVTPIGRQDRRASQWNIWRYMGGATFSLLHGLQFLLIEMPVPHVLSLCLADIAMPQSHAQASDSVTVSE